MPDSSVHEALKFVDSIQLPERFSELERAETVPFDFDAARNQAAIVGSEIVSFVRGVTEERRRDVVNATLLAQLAADRRVGDPTDLFAWYDTYFDVLTNTGWVVQTKQFVDHAEHSQDLHAHEAILRIATSLLGPGTAALQVIQTTLDALAKMDRDSPWITLFDRESQRASSARFQVTLAEQGADDQFLVTLMAFALTAQANLTQVLFFKFRSNEVRLRHSSGRLSVNETVLDAVRELIESKLGERSSAFVRSLPDLD
ncbi:hypothetical protein [Sinorhizobium meliloti]|uniref:hypothetical protein n=1 Tax=Rhizobium meliloti TaxID=382 RepID=UPI00209002FA|nr:hypothetical protein [Sinorhizobium meliloti]MCO5966030.1 hypothetical protein [Sinorhizobium meliloti]